jgi:hypothetical protein
VLDALQRVSEVNVASGMLEAVVDVSPACASHTRALAQAGRLRRQAAVPRADLPALILRIKEAAADIVVLRSSPDRALT